MANSPKAGPDYSPQLQDLMRSAGIASYRALSSQAGVSRSAINRLRHGQIGRLRVEVLLLLSRVLRTSVATLLGTFTPAETPEDTFAPATLPAPDVDSLQREYERLKQRLVEQEGEVRRRVQGDAIAMLESWLVNWPTAVYAVQQNDSLPATRLLPLIKPLDALLQSWDVVPIGTVGDEVPFDPQIHQLMQGNPQVGQRVRVRNVGYYHGDRLLFRAKVSLVDPG